MPNSEFEIIKLKDLASKLAGSIIKKGDSEYDDFRTGWNGYFDKLPLAIARCTGKNDVAGVLTLPEHIALNFQ